MPDRYLCPKRISARRSRGACGIAAALAAGLGMAAGCDRESEGQARIHEAASAINSLTGGGSAPATTQAQRDVFTRVTTELQPVAQTGALGERGASGVLLSKAHGGLADIPVAEALDAERRATLMMSEASGMLSAWATHHANAAGARAYDPSGPLAEIQTQRVAVRARVAETSAARAAVQSQVDALASRAAGLHQEADAALGSYTDLASRAQRASPSEALTLFESARNLKRRSDALRREAGDLEAQAGVISPRLASFDVEIASLNGRLQDFDAIQTRLNERLAAAQAEAESSDREATGLANDLDRKVAEIEELRSGALARAYDDAVAALGRAVSAGQASAGELRGPGKLAAGIARQSLGDLHWHRARGHAAYAEFLESLAATPDLPNREDFRSKAAAARAAMRASLTEAVSAYEAAEADFLGGGGQGETRERLERVSRSVRALSLMAGGRAPTFEAALEQAAEPAAEEAMTPEEDAPDAGAMVNGDAGAVGDEAAIRALYDAQMSALRERRLEDALATVHIPAGGARAMLEASMMMSIGLCDLDAAARQRFNTGALELLQGVPGIGVMIAQQMRASGMTDLAAACAADSASLSQLSVEGDTARALSPFSPVPLEFIRVDGVWKTRVSLLEGMGDAAAPLARMLRAQGDVFLDLAGRIRGGEIADVAGFNTAFGAAMQPLMQQMMQGGGGGAGGGG